MFVTQDRWPLTTSNNGKPVAVLVALIDGAGLLTGMDDVVSDEFERSPHSYGDTGIQVPIHSVIGFGLRRFRRSQARFELKGRFDVGNLQIPVF